MNINIYPDKYKEERLKKAACDAALVYQEMAGRRKAIENAKNEIVHKSIDVSLETLLQFVCMALCFLGPIIYMYQCILGDPTLPWYVLPLIGIAGMIIIATVSKRRDKRYIKTRDNAVVAADQEVAAIEAEQAEMIREINKEADRDISANTAAFESAAQNKSIEYAGSDAVTEAAEWISDGFLNFIDSAKRSNLNSSVQAEYSVKVFSDMLVCDDLGTYNLSARWRMNLNQPVAQAAFARALASETATVVRMKYGRDVTGGDYMIDSTYDYHYEKQFVNLTMHYSAVNGRYQAVRNWDE